MTRRLDVFFYGLFMDEDLLRAKGVTPQNRRIASVRDSRLLIGHRATLIPFTGGIVYGVVFSLTHAEIDALYSDEMVSEYRPEAVLARTDTGLEAALCFNLPTPPAADERNLEYAAKLKSLAERLGLPQAYIESI